MLFQPEAYVTPCHQTGVPFGPNTDQDTTRIFVIRKNSSHVDSVPSDDRIVDPYPMGGHNAKNAVV